MNKREIQQQKARIVRLSKKWCSVLGLGWWEIETEHVDKLSHPGYETVFMLTSSDWQYMRAKITVGLEDIAELSDYQLEGCYLHELMHIFLAELDGNPKDWDKHVERVATQLSRAFLWFREEIEKN